MWPLLICINVYAIRVGRLLRLVSEEAPDVFSFPLLDPAMCNVLLEEVQHYSEFQSQQPHQQLRHPTESAPSSDGVAAPTRLL